MKENTTLIDYLEKIYKANRPEDFKRLLDVQIKLNELDKNYRDLTAMYNEAIMRNVKMEYKVRINESKALKYKSSVDVLKQEIESLKTQIKNLTENIEI